MPRRWHAAWSGKRVGDVIDMDSHEIEILEIV
jgi:hypothetical protein